MSGAPLTKLLDADASKEVAVFGAVWIDGSPAQYVRRVKDIEHFERGGAFRITKRISDPTRAAASRRPERAKHASATESDSQSGRA